MIPPPDWSHLNPVIVVNVLKKEMSQWKERIYSLIDERSTATDDEIAWQFVRGVSLKGAALLRSFVDQQRGKNGRLSIQTDAGIS
jgi:transaldolase